MTPRRPRDRTATRAALLTSARRRFTQHGYDRTRVRDIAADAHVDPALIFRYFGSKEALFREAVTTDLPDQIGPDPRPLHHITDAMLHQVVFGDTQTYDGDHPLLVMLRSAGDGRIRDLLRDQICDGYLTEFADRIPHDDAALRAELIGALLLGLGVMRSVIATPALAAATPDDLRLLVAKTVAVLADSAMKGNECNGG